MSYRSHRRIGLGQAPTTTTGFAPGVPTVRASVALPSWDIATSGQADIQKNNNNYRKIGDENLLNMMRQRLEDVHAIDPTDVDPDTGLKTARKHVRDWLNNQQYEVREGMPFIQALKAWWVRQGRVPNRWPGEPQESSDSINFGPNTDNSTALQIAQNFYESFRNPSTPLWQKYAGDGYVRLRNNDYLWNHIVRQALINQGYLASDAEVNTKDDGPMVRALEGFYREGAAAGGSKVGLDYGSWPSDTALGANTAINFGPNTNGDEVRIDEKLLTAVLNGWSAREVAARNAAAGALRDATIRPPLIGLPSQGATRPLATMLSPAALRAATSSITPLFRATIITPTTTK